MRAQRRTRNEVGLENTRTTRDVKAQRRTQKEMRAQRRTQNEVGLENALPEWWWLKGALGMR